MSLNSLYSIFAYTSLFSYLISITIGLRMYNVLTGYQKKLLIACVASFFFFGLSVVLYFYRIYNINLTYLSTFVGIIIKLLFFRDILQNEKIKKTSTILAISVLVVDIGEAIYRNFSEMNNITALFEYFWIISVSFYAMRNLFKLNARNSIRNQNLFWIILGFLNYAVFSLFFDTFSNQLLKYSNQLFTILSLFIYISVIISNILYAIGFQKAKRFYAEQIHKV